MKDIIIEIAVKSENFYSLSLCCKKFYTYILNNKDFWRRKILYRFKYLCKEKDLKKLQEFYILLDNISQNPQMYYRKSIIKNDYKQEQLIYNIFKVYYPYIGIVKNNNPNYFSIIDIVNLYDRIPENEINLANMDELTVWNHCRNMGILYTYDKTFNIHNIKKKLSGLNLIFDINEKNDYLIEIFQK